MININSLTFSIQGIPLLKDASAFIRKGHKIGIVGRNGEAEDFETVVDERCRVRR